MADETLIAAFETGGPAASERSDAAEIDGALLSVLRRSREHGSRPADDEAFVAYLGQRCDTEDIVAFLERLDVEAMALAFACRDGAGPGLRRFEATYFHEVKVGASRLGCTEDELDQIRQATREALFGPGPDGRPKLLAMTARGELRALIRLIALRAGISLRRKEQRHTGDSDDALLAIDDLGATPSLAVVKDQHRERFAEALRAAVARLDVRARTLLRMYEIDGLDQRALATMHRVDRSTVARWLARARQDLLAHTRRELAERFGVRHGELDSFLDVLRSGFDVSVFRFLRQHDADSSDPPAR
ncbi:MAG: sigma factor-like helix-turn-helix DNA-binding protein [Myxococcota bacterium]